MRQPTTRSDASIVDEQIGTSYDVVKKVHDNLAIIGTAADVSDDIVPIKDNIGSVQTVANNINNINTVTGSITDIEAVVNNLTVIQSVPQTAIDVENIKNEVLTARDTTLGSQTIVENAETNVIGLEGDAETHKNAAEAAAIRAEAAAQTASSAFTVRGDWDASAGVFPTPTLSSERADFYHISVAGVMRNPSDPNQEDIDAKVGEELYWNIDNDVWYLIGKQVDSIDKVASAARTEADLYEMIEQNKTKYAASSFVDYGKHFESVTSGYNAINEGLWTDYNSPNTLWIGAEASSGKGSSESAFAKTHIAGFISSIYGVGYTDINKHTKIKFPEAPKGTVVYDSSGNVRGTGLASIDLMIDSDPKYGNIADTHNEAVARAFEGSFIRNGNFREGATNWTTNSLCNVSTSGAVFTGGGLGTLSQINSLVDVVDEDYVISFVADASEEINIVLYGKPGAANDGSLNVQTVVGYNEFIFPFTGRTGEFARDNGIYISALEPITISQISARPVTEEVVTDRVDVFGAEFFLEEFDVYNPYVYPKGMIQSRVSSMNGVPTTSTNKPATYYHTFPRPLGNNIWTAGTAITDGSFDSPFAVIKADDPSKLEKDKTYNITYDYSVTSGSLQLIVGTEGTVHSTGSHSSTIVVNSASFLQVRQTTANSVGFISNIQIREVSTEDNGLGVNFFEATKEQQLAIVRDPTNNIFRMNDGRWVQWRMRQRTIAGIGNGNWANTNCVNDDFLKFNLNDFVKPQGILDLPVYGDSSVFVGNHAWNKKGYAQGVFTAHAGTNDNWVGAVDGKCYFHVWGAIPRLNQGGYHPFNENGTKTFSSVGAGSNYKWFDNTVKGINTKAECFYVTDSNKPAGTIGVTTDSGFVGSTHGSGREDNLLYDVIYSSGQGGVIDTRLSAWDMSTPQVAAVVDSKVKAGTYRGMEHLIYTKIQHFFDYHSIQENSTFTKAGDAFIQESPSYGWYGYHIKVNVSNTPTNHLSSFNASINETNNESLKSYVVYVGNNGASFVARGISNFADTSSNHSLIPIGNFKERQTELSNFNTLFPNGTTITVYVVNATYSNLPVESTFTTKDVGGNPQNILGVKELKDGWYGYWLPRVLDGSSTYTQTQLTRKNIIYNTIIQLKTDDLGVNWVRDNTIGVAVETNFITSTDVIPINRVEIFYYFTPSYVTEKDENRTIFNGYFGVGGLFSTFRNEAVFGGLLSESLIQKPLTGSFQRNIQGINNSLFLESTNIDTRDGKLYSLSNAFGELKHPPLTLGVPNNNSLAIKTLNYQTAENQVLYLNYIFKELAYTPAAFNAWGDNRYLGITDYGYSTTLDSNNVGVVQGINRLTKPYGYAGNKNKA